MPRTHLGLKWVIFLARSPLIRPHWLGEPCGDWAGKRWRVCRFAMSIVLVKYGSILRNSGYFWAHFSPHNLLYLYFFLPLQLAKRCETTIVGFLFQRAFVWYATWWGANVNQGPKNVKNTFTLQKVTWYMLKWKKNHVLVDNFFVCGPISKI